jgi:hypothetical protein
LGCSLLADHLALLMELGGRELSYRQPPKERGAGVMIRAARGLLLLPLLLHGWRLVIKEGYCTQSLSS